MRKKQKHIKLSILLLGCFLPSILTASNAQLTFKHFTTQDGLSESSVISICQDHFGFMWFGTQNGLNKYDGYKFTCYRNDPNDSSSLSHNDILAIYEDRHNKLWIGTNGGGLNLYDRLTDSFIHFQHDQADSMSLSDNSIRSIFEDGHGNLWIGTFRGLNLFDRKNQCFLRQIHNSKIFSVLADQCIEALCEDADGELWIGATRIGLFRYNIFHNEYQNISSSNEFIDLNFIKKIVCDRYGRIWIATETSGLILFLKKENKLIHFKNDANNPHSIAHHSIHSLGIDREDNLWIGTENGGLNKLIENKQNIVKSTFIRYTHDVNNPQSISNNTPSAIYEDAQGNLWVGAYRGGVNLMVKHQEKFLHYKSEPNNPQSLSHNTIQAIFEDRDNNIWIGTDGGGLNRYLPETNSFDRFNHNKKDPQSLISDNALAICEADNNHLWIGTWEGLDLFNCMTQKFSHYQFEQNANRIIGLNNINFLLKDKRRNLWIASNGGLIQLDHKNILVNIFRNLPDDSSTLSNNCIYTLFEDSKSNLWIGTNWGLNLLPVEKRAKNNYFFIRFLENGPNAIRGSSISFIYEDSQNNLWIGTNKGLNLYHPILNNFTYYSIYDGLPSDWIKNMREDRQGNLWISTKNGLSQFNPVTKVFKNYNLNDGLQNNEFTGGCCKSRSGKLYFGGINGFNVLEPDNIQDNSFIPPVVITDFQIFNKSVPLSRFVKPNNLNPDVPHIQLSSKENVFSFEFAALDYTNPLKNQYAYIMKGFDSEWTFTGANRRFATYTNLSHGNYRFHVKASNNNGLWNERGTSINITITPPFWKSYWAYLIYFGMFVLLVYGYHRYYMNLVRLKTDLKLEKLNKEKAVELEQIKTTFFTNISHEFKTPLTLILVPLQELMLHSNKRMKQRLLFIQKNSLHLLKLVNQVLDFKKLETGHLCIERCTIELIAYTRSIFNNFVPLALEKHIHLHFGTAINQCHLSIDPEKMEMVINNLLSNALKFTPDHGKVAVSILAPTIDTINIVVEDSGSGIDGEHLPHIFERFYHVDVNPSQKGTGIGLTLSKDLVELHEGQICVENITPPPGARFTIMLPIFNSKPLILDQIAEPLLDNIKSTSRKSTEVKKEKPLLLIVEDSSNMRECLRFELSSDYIIEEAENGIVGFRKAIELIPDLMICDIMMTEMDGLELCSRLKNHELTSHIPIILLTARTTESQQREGLKTGADDYINKPFNLSTLKVKISNLIEIRNKLKKQFSQEIRLEAKDIVITDLDAKFLKRAVQIVENNIDESSFNVDKLTQLMGTSRSQLFRKLKGLTDQRPQEFIRSIRLKQAAQLLAKSKMTIIEICYASGFNFPAHFALQFRAKYGLNPKEYRKQFNKLSQPFPE